METITYTFLQKQGLKSKIQPLECILNLFIIICSLLLLFNNIIIN